MPASIIHPCKSLHSSSDDKIKHPLLGNSEAAAKSTSFKHFRLCSNLVLNSDATGTH